MTTATVFKPQEIVLNGIRYPIKGPVQSALISNDPLKIVTADTSRDTHKNLSVQSWSDWTGGIGKDKISGENVADNRRAWYSECQLLHGHLVLPWLATRTGAGAARDVGVISEYNNVIYAAYGTDFRSYSAVTDTWTNVRTLAAVATDELHDVRLAGATYMIIAQDTDYDYYNGTTWARSTKNVKYLALWDDRVWGIDSTGQLWFAYTLGTEVNDAQLPLGNDSVTGLFVGYDSAGRSILYATTTRGLFAHDLANTSFKARQATSPFHPDNGRGRASWQESMYISSGLAVHEYTLDANRAVVRQVGPDRDDGLPTNRRGTVKQLIPSFNELLAIIDATAIGAVGNLFLSQNTSNAMTMDPNAGFSHILGWDTIGWQSKWVSASATLAITWALVSNAYSDYRLWWGQDQRVYWMKIPANIINPTYVTDVPYAASALHETPDFTGGQSEVDKLAVRLRAEVNGMSTTETIILAFALNGSTIYTTMTDVYSSDVNASGEITSNGKKTYQFPSRTAPSGTEFRSIRFRASLARGSTTTLTPDLLKLELEWRKKLPALWGHQVTVDLSSAYGGASKELMFENLRAAVEANLKSRFTFRDRDADDAGNTNPYVYYVDIVSALGLERTGNDWSGEVTLLLVEI